MQTNITIADFRSAVEMTRIMQKGEVNGGDYTEEFNDICARFGSKMELMELYSLATALKIFALNNNFKENDRYLRAAAEHGKSGLITVGKTGAGYFRVDVPGGAESDYRVFANREDAITHAQHMSSQTGRDMIDLDNPDAEPMGYLFIPTGDVPHEGDAE